MGNTEEKKISKPEKSSSPAPEQTSSHVYPDWAALQAYYGPRMTVPPYFNSAIAPGHAPHPYMWGPPQAMMPPFGAPPYAAIYSHGGIYTHPVPLAATPASVETPTKSSGNTVQGLVKKLKGFDGLAMSIGNGNAEPVDGGTDHGLSQSEETAGSSNGSDGNTAGAAQTSRKRSCEGTTPKTGGNGKAETVEVNANSSKVLGITVPLASVPGKVAGTILSPSGTTTMLELGNSSSMNANSSSPVLPSEAWIQNDRELKRERRKQSNRESARRSRLRKQAEAEELAIKVESLKTENMALKSELSRLTDNSERLRVENATLMDKLKQAQQAQTEERVANSVDNKRMPSVSTENLLSRVNNSGPVEKESNMYGKISKSGAKLHQLMDKGSRPDAVAAS